MSTEIPGALAEQYLTAYSVAAPTTGPSGTPVGEATLPGRHWRELAGAFRAWGLTALAELWSRPWPDPDADPWPFPMYADPEQVARIDAELTDFDLDRIHDEPDLLPDGDDDADEVTWLLEEKLPAWIAAVRADGHGLYLLRDGGR